jgi:ribosomal protein S6
VKKYEGLFIFDETVQEERLKDLAAYVMGEITKAGGKVLESKDLGRQSFARVMQKKESGFYLSVIFNIAPDKVTVLTSRYHLNDDIFRVQITCFDDKLVNTAPVVPVSA